MSRGRPPGPEKDRLHLKIDMDVSLYFRMLFHDDFTGTMSKGKMSELVNTLLRREMEFRKQMTTTATATPTKEK